MALILFYCMINLVNDATVILCEVRLYSPDVSLLTAGQSFILEITAETVVKFRTEHVWISWMMYTT